MFDPSLGATGLAAALAFVGIGGGLYEFLVVDPAWPDRPDIPKALAFERADPATIAADTARRWVRRSLWRLPLDLVTGLAMVMALANALAG